MATMESKLKIKAVQTVVPMKPTNPRQFLHITIPENVGSSIYKTSLNLVFCYNKSSEEDSGSDLVAGWIKESLGMALSEKPILAGRLRQKEDGDGGEMEIVSNDSGIRLIEAQIDDVSLQEFLDLKNNNKEEYDEGVLVFWKDIDHEMNPQYSPLVYIQVTSFNSGGYSIGISSSLILIDPFSVINFLKTWTNIHLQLISNSTKPPLFYRPNHEPTNPSLNQSNGPASKRACTQTTIFKIENNNNNNNKNHKSLAEMCIYEAEKKIGKKPRSSKFVLYVKESTDDEIKITRFEKEVFGEEKEKEKPFVSKNEISFGHFEEISFSKDCKPDYCSWWIRVDDDDDDEGVVMVLPSLELGGSAGLKIIATLPVDQK